jgi:hypothetical protein
VKAAYVTDQWRECVCNATPQYKAYMQCLADPPLWLHVLSRVPRVVSHAPVSLVLLGNNGSGHASAREEDVAISSATRQNEPLSHWRLLGLVIGGKSVSVEGMKVLIPEKLGAIFSRSPSNARERLSRWHSLCLNCPRPKIVRT